MSRIRADRVVNKTATDGPEFPLGATLPTTGTLSGPGGVNLTGVITATKFVGDGSGLINLASQQQNTGVVIRDDNNLIGTAQTINFGTNANVSPIAGGICTVTSVNTDTNTEYTYQALPNGNNVLLRLTGTPGGAYDDINVVAGTNVVFDQVTTTGFRINNSAIAGITSVFIDPSPRLGGTLDLNGKAILGSTSVNVTGTIKATNFEGDLTGDVTGVSTFAYGLTGTPNITVGDITAAGAAFSGDVSIGGTLTYEDVQNVDAVGLITARSGIKVQTGGIEVTSGGLSVDNGFTTLGGDGSNSGVIINDGAIQIKTNTGNPSYIDFYCEVTNAHKVTIKAPPHAQYSGNVTFQLPPNNGSDGSLLTSDGNGATSWQNYTTAKWHSEPSGIHTTSKVGIGTTNPLSTLQVDQAGYESKEGSWTANAGVPEPIDTFSISTHDFCVAEYTVYIQNPGATNIGETQVQKILITQDGTDAHYEEFGIMSNPNKLVSLSADINSGNCRLIATPETGVTGITTYKFIRTTIL